MVATRLAEVDRRRNARITACPRRGGSVSVLPNRGLFMIRLVMPLCVVMFAGLLAGCELTDPALLAGPQRVGLLNGALTVAAPRGYCVDRAAIRQERDTAVVLIGRCRSDGSAQLQVPAVVTVSVGQGGSAGVMTAGGAALSAFFTSTEGRAVLARSGRAADVRVLQARGRADAFVMQLSDRQVGVYWRAVTGIGGRLVTVSAAGPDTSAEGGVALSPQAGLALVDATLLALRAANPG